MEPRIHEHAFKQKERLLAAILLGQVASFLLALTGIASALLASKVCLVLSHITYHIGTKVHACAGCPEARLIY